MVIFRVRGEEDANWLNTRIVACVQFHSLVQPSLVTSSFKTHVYAFIMALHQTIGGVTVAMSIFYTVGTHETKQFFCSPPTEKCEGGYMMFWACVFFSCSG